MCEFFNILFNLISIEIYFHYQKKITNEFIKFMNVVIAAHLTQTLSQQQKTGIILSSLTFKKSSHNSKSNV